MFNGGGRCVPTGWREVVRTKGWDSGRKDVGVDLYDGAEGAGEWWRAIVGVEKIGSPDGSCGRGMLRGKSRPCLYRF